MSQKWNNPAPLRFVTDFMISIIGQGGADWYLYSQIFLAGPTAAVASSYLLGTELSVGSVAFNTALLWAGTSAVTVTFDKMAKPFNTSDRDMYAVGAAALTMGGYSFWKQGNLETAAMSALLYAGATWLYGYSGPYFPVVTSYLFNPSNVGLPLWPWHWYE